MGAIGIVMCCIGWSLTCASLLNHNWKVSTVSGSGTRFENLWRFCTKDDAGIEKCNDSKTLSAIPAFIVMCRTLMIMSLLLGVSAMITSTLCLKCSIGTGSCIYESKWTVTYGIFNSLGGLCCIMAVSWYSIMVLDFKLFETAVGIHLGLSGAIFSIMGGGMLCSQCRAENSRPGYQENQPATINTTAAQSAQETEMSYV